IGNDGEQECEREHATANARHVSTTNSDQQPATSNQRPATSYGADGGGTRFLVACSNEYASSSSRGSLQAAPVKLTPNGPGFASNPAGNGGVGTFGTIANGTMIVG